jgi:hypothetical protein
MLRRMSLDPVSIRRARFCAFPTEKLANQNSCVFEVSSVERNELKVGTYLVREC